MKRAWSILFVPLMSWAAPCDLKLFLTQDGEALWKQTERDVLKKYPGVFHRIDRNRAELKAEKDLLFGREKVPECRVIFSSDGRLGRILISLYNRGDSGALDRDAFRRRVENLTDQLASMIPAGGEPVKKSNMRLNDAKVDSYQFVLPDATAILRCSEGRSGGEFITLEWLPKSAAAQDLRHAMQTHSDRKTLSDKIRRGTDGSIYLEVPMVDQGTKGYCVVATVERILRYYGAASIDQHVLADLGRSDAMNGTMLSQMYTQLEQLSGRLKIRIERIQELSFFHSDEAFYTFLSAYNRQVPRKKRVNIPAYSRGSLNVLLSQTQVDAFIKARDINRSGQRIFLRTIRENIDKGQPLCWSVCEPVQGKAPLHHMRIINGYSPDGKRVIYSDSYGPGHEAKVMDIRLAWAITNELWVIKPR